MKAYIDGMGIRFLILISGVIAAAAMTVFIAAPLLQNAPPVAGLALLLPSAALLAILYQRRR